MSWLITSPANKSVLLANPADNVSELSFGVCIKGRGGEVAGAHRAQDEGREGFSHLNGA